MAFALGTTTAFPALKYFCIYASIGIILDFWFQISFFCAALVCPPPHSRLHWALATIFRPMHAPALVAERTEPRKQC